MDKGEPEGQPLGGAHCSPNIPRGRPPTLDIVGQPDQKNQDPPSQSAGWLLKKGLKLAQGRYDRAVVPVREKQCRVDAVSDEIKERFGADAIRRGSDPNLGGKEPDPPKPRPGNEKLPKRVLFRARTWIWRTTIVSNCRPMVCREGPDASFVRNRSLSFPSSSVSVRGRRPGSGYNSRMREGDN